MNDQPQDPAKKKAPPTGPLADKAEALYCDGRLVDIRVCRKGRELLMLGPGGPARELALLPPKSGPDRSQSEPPQKAGGSSPAAPLPQTSIPVLLGAGTGAALAEVVKRLDAAHGPDFMLVIADKESDIQEASRVRERFAAHSGLRWLDEPEPEKAVRELTRIQESFDCLPFQPLVNPFYLRLDRDWYGALRRVAEDSAKVDFWSRARVPRFVKGPPRLLLLTSKYFLMGEIIAACKRLDYPYRLLQVPAGEMPYGDFIGQLLTAVVEFRPDFAFTINHLGVDREGLLTELTEKLRLPLASWFVDNPHLVLYLYPRLSSPWTTLFTWDADNLDSLRAKGFDQVRYLPLGVDAARFKPPEAPPFFAGLPKAWDRRLAFVGNSMVHKVLSRKKRSRLPLLLAESYEEVGRGFADSEERSVSDFLARARPDLFAAFAAMPSIDERLGYETTLTWEATRQYRLHCVRSILPFSPLIAGDDGWRQLLAGASWHYHGEMSYYDDLPRFYPCADINFNCTSKQMKGAVNQRVFDVPACGAFLLTDYREQIENLFEPGREIICYHSPEEATALAAEYLERPGERAAVIRAARRRILAGHTYEHRLRALTDAMRDLYG
ncbi:glycosyltransferase [Desulfovibrio sp. OttesenSCG-928-G11]|nr:glycosyltransferase [Desulfovibrio sp. OttesenSCG-928-G11]